MQTRDIEVSLSYHVIVDRPTLEEHMCAATVSAQS